jgi:hypothetical protein
MYFRSDNGLCCFDQIHVTLSTLCRSWKKSLSTIQVLDFISINCNLVSKDFSTGFFSYDLTIVFRNHY